MQLSWPTPLRQTSEKKLKCTTYLVTSPKISTCPRSLPLSEMTIEEKLQAMEALWEDLSRTPDLLESPAWHQDVLRERELAAGEASFMDWGQAKVYIRSRTS